MLVATAAIVGIPGLPAVEQSQNVQAGYSLEVAVVRDEGDLVPQGDVSRYENESCKKRNQMLPSALAPSIQGGAVVQLLNAGLGNSDGLPGDQISVVEPQLTVPEQIRDDVRVRDELRVDHFRGPIGCCPRRMRRTSSSNPSYRGPGDFDIRSSISIGPTPCSAASSANV